MVQAGHAVKTVHQPIRASIKSGYGLRVGSGAMAEHYANAASLEMGDGFQRTGLFRRQRHHTKRVLRLGNQRIQLIDVQFAEQFGRVGSLVLRREVRPLKIAPQ